jgi:hypothetical protein
VDVRPARQICRIDFDHWSDHHELPVGTRRRDAVEQRNVEALVEHAEEAKPRVRDGALIGGIAIDLPRRREVGDVDAAGHRVNVLVAVLLRVIERLAAGEHHVRLAEQLMFERDQLLRRVLERRELVHAVVDGGQRLEVPGKLQSQRRVVPRDET